jgi:hypothetical protein
MWVGCAGALALPANQRDSSSTYADDGTVSHSLASWTLDDPRRMCENFPHSSVTLNGATYEVDDERLERIQSYVDDIRRSAIGGILWPEHRVDLSRYLGMALCPRCEGSCSIATKAGFKTCPECDGDGEVPQGGTSDAVVILPKIETLIVSDLKDGAGERVYAAYKNAKGVLEVNIQLGLYGLGCLEDALLLGHKLTKVIFRIYQPRLNHMDEFEMTVADLLGAFVKRIKAAADRVGEALVMPPDPAKLDEAGLLGPADVKTCRWCKAAADCPAMTRFVRAETKADFEDETQGELAIPRDVEALARAFKAMPLIMMWVKATNAAIWQGVQAGDQIIGPDGQPLKIVEAGGGKRAWIPEKLLSGEVEAALVGQLGEAAYEPRKAISAPEAAKKLDKKKTKALWEEQFVPLFKKSKGSPQLALGSDTRPPYSAASSADDFADEIGVE